MYLGTLVEKERSIMRILLVDDHKIVRDGIEQLIINNSQHEVVASVSDGFEAIKQVKALEPDMVITDIAMPNMNGIEVAKAVNAFNPEIKIIALSMHSERAYVLEMLKAGVSGYLLKDVAFEELLNAIDAVNRNQIYLSASISSAIVENYVTEIRTSETSQIDSLTSREKEVLKLIADGLTTAEIAAELKISEKTVEAHRRNIMTKLNIFSIALLTKFTIKEGLTSI